MPTKTSLKKNKMTKSVEAHDCVTVTPKSTKAGKSLRDDDDNSIDDFVVGEFRSHRLAALKKHKRECVTYDTDANLYNNRKHMESESSCGTGGVIKGHCPTCNRKRGFGLVEAEDMANELMGVVMHVDDLLDEAQESLRKVKAQFWAAVWGAGRWEKKYGQSWSKISRRSQYNDEHLLRYACCYIEFAW